MSELTLTLLRLGLLALLWVFIFSVVGILRTDIYGTTVSRRSQRRAQRHQEKEQEKAQQRARAAQPVAVAPKPARRGRGKRVPTTLVVTEGPLAGTSLPLRQAGILIGRNPECALVLDDDYASGRHCRIYPSGDGWFVEDLGSTNGTFMGREKLTAPRPVDVGSSLRIGKTVLELRA
jgi:pSer/pThr/pTyr-binding forkhead associated (FHA) protein